MLRKSELLLGEELKKLLATNLFFCEILQEALPLEDQPG